MTPRAIILGLLGAVFIATAGYFGYTVPKLAPLGNNFFPIIVFFPLILVAGVINPVLKRLGSWRPLAGPEQAAIVLIMLIATGLMDTEALAAVPDKLWTLIEIGLGGYIVSRGAEKIVPGIVGSLKKKDEL